MSSENPTLKIRFQVSDAALGTDCQAYADKIARKADMGLTVLDAKWGRKPTEWYPTRTWGRPRLSERDAGFVEAIRSLDRPEGVETRLLAIIEKLTKS